MFSYKQYIKRSLIHYWRQWLPVGLATAVGTAVLTGSLLVGASMRSSLAALTQERLGRVTRVLDSGLFFREELAEGFGDAEAVILLEGSVAQADTGARVNGAQVIGIDEGFWTMDVNERKRPTPGALEAVVNQSLAEALNLQTGDEILVRIQRPSAIPADTFMGNRSDTVEVLRLEITTTPIDGGIADFSTRATQGSVFNVFVNRQALQQRLEMEGQVNQVVVAETAARASAENETWPPAARERFALGDVGLRTRPTSSGVWLESARLLLSDYEMSLVDSDISDTPTLTLYQGGEPDVYQARPVYAYLANELTCHDRAIPYATVAGVDWGGATNAYGPLEDGVILNQWAADELNAKPGDRLTMRYFVDGPRGGLVETLTSFTVTGVVGMDDPRIRDEMIPSYPGISGVESVSDWDPPFPMDMGRIRDEDETYWDEYGAAPKALVSMATAWRLWGRRYGPASSVLLKPTHIIGNKSPDEMAGDIERHILAEMEPERLGMVLRPVLAEGLKSSQGATDFGGLFVGFSLFLLVSAGGLIRMLFLLAMEGRCRELGLLSALGYRPGRRLGWKWLGFSFPGWAERSVLHEGLLISALGSLVGGALAVVYGAVMIYGLRNWWVGSIGSPFVRLHVDGASLAIGVLGGWLIAVWTLWRVAARMSRMDPRDLLVGRLESQETTQKSGSQRGFISAGLAILGMALIGAGGWVSAGEQAVLFFCGAAALLAAAIVGFNLWLRASGHPGRKRLTLARLGMLAARRQSGRSTLVVLLMASAAFLIVAVGANRRVATEGGERLSGTGGFALLGESSAPLLEGLDKDRLPVGSTVYPIKLRPGEDAGCLNLYRVSRPRFLGVNDAFIERGGFLFAGSLARTPEDKKNPWRLLRQEVKDDAIPVIGDFNTVMWLLKSGLGKVIEFEGQKYRFVALLKGSVFQGEILMSTERFRELFPYQPGWRYFAIDAPALFQSDTGTSTPAERVEALGRDLESSLEDYGFDAVGAAAKLNNLMAVENAYLSTFQALGGLGLLLGTLGLGLVLARNLLERRAEFALMGAVGLKRRDRIRVAVAENGLLLVAGLAIGTIGALIAVGPSALARHVAPPWGSLALTLGGIVVFGFVTIELVARLALRGSELDTLRRE